MSLNPTRDRYESINKRNFHSAVINLLENEYKILGSRKILGMLADDIENLHREYYPGKDQIGFGEIIFTTTNVVIVNKLLHWHDIFLSGKSVNLKSLL